jgi:acetyl esterase/lipase
MKSAIHLFILLFVFGQSYAFAQKKSSGYSPEVPKPTLLEISYGTHERNILDFWKAESDSPTPVAFVIHGGGWKGGSKERLDRFADPNALLKAGISIVAINYRYVTSTEKPPVKAPLHDAARALQFVRSKAKAWNLNKERIGAAGGSAGACSSLWLAFHDDLADPKSKDPVVRESSRLACAAVIGAQTTLNPKQMVEWTPNSRYGGHAFGLRSFADFLKQREKILPWIAEYSPYALVSKDDPPVYLLYRTPPAIGKEQKDPTHTSNFGVKLQDHCKSQGVDCELVYPGLPNVKHENPTAFLISQLKRKSAND